MSSPNTVRSKTEPIPIHGRARSASESSVESEPTATPAASVNGSPPRIKVATSPSTSPTSPILSYFFPGSPTKSPFKTGAVNPYAPVLEDDDEPPAVLPASAHARRLSTSWTVPRVGQPPAPGPDERSAGLLRRLSLGSAFAKPPPPAPNMPGPATGQPGVRRPRRSTTVAGPAAAAVVKQPRAPSPMGERILKGHFDGFV